MNIYYKFFFVLKFVLLDNFMNIIIILYRYQLIILICIHEKHQSIEKFN
jgi:hypothetical protein